MRTSRRPTAAAGFALGLAALAVVTSGCNLNSPVAKANYQAAEGADLTLPDVRLSNFVVVASAKDEPGVVVGAVSTENMKPVQVKITVLNGSSSLGETTVTAEPGKLANLASGEGASAIQLSSVPVLPGGNLTLRATTEAGGKDVTLPVVLAGEQYKSITPSASASS